jgi:hypothetical protein
VMAELLTFGTLVPAGIEVLTKVRAAILSDQPP